MAKKNKFRYGFQAECKRWANELREEMGLQLGEPLCPRALCEYLYIPILELSHLRANQTELNNIKAIDYLLSPKGLVEFSATVCFDGIKAFIIINDYQSELRLASNIAHEVAHILLRHPPEQLFDKNGRRNLIKDYEDEAEWLGPELLVSEYAALNAYRMISRGDHSISSLSLEWKITEQIINMRMNVVGARRRCA